MQLIKIAELIQDDKFGANYKVKSKVQVYKLEEVLSWLHRKAGMEKEECRMILQAMCKLEIIRERQEKGGSFPKQLLSRISKKMFTEKEVIPLPSNFSFYERQDKENMQKEDEEEGKEKILKASLRDSLTKSKNDTKYFEDPEAIDSEPEEDEDLK